MMERKVIAGFTATALIVLLFGTYAVLQMRELSSLTYRMYNHPLAVTNATKTIQIRFLNIQAHLETLIDLGESEKVEEITALIEKEEKEVLMLYALLFERYLGNREDIEKSHRAFQQWNREHDFVISLANSGKKSEAWNINQKRVDELAQDIQTLVDFARNKSEYFLANAKSTAKQTIFVTIVMMILAVTAVLVGALWLVRNIRHSQRELRQRQSDLLRTSHELLRAQEIAKLGIWRWDIPKDEMHWDSISYRLHEYPEGNPISSEEIEQFIHPEDVIRVRTAVHEHFLKGDTFAMDFRIITAKGNLKHMRVQCETVFDSEKNPSFINGIIQDITDEVVKQEHLLHQLRLAQMGEMISMIAHQWRQPLGAIASVVIDLKMERELKTYDLCKEKEQEQFEKHFFQSLRDIERFIKNMTTTIDDFRNFYKQNKKAEMTTLMNPISQSLDLMKAAFESQGIKWGVVNSCHKEVKMFPSEIVQVLLNILKNALDNFREKKVKNGKIEIRCVDFSEGVEVRIWDNGGGIPKELAEKIYDPYFSTKNEKNGTGLGLYMSKMIIQEHHQGTLRHVNMEGGACFIITIKDAV